MPGGDPFFAVLGALAILLAVNRLALPRVAHRLIFFVPIVAADIAVAAGTALFGLPGLQDMGAVRWIVSALMALHVALAFSERSKARWVIERTTHQAERRRIMRESREAAPPEPAPPEP